ncbi:MAG: hypothetical protein ACKO8Q_01335, partial [Bacteroidota bacterium]
ADASGNYFLRWERDQAINYKIVASKDNYYSKEIFLNPDNLNIGSEYNQSIPLIAKSSIRLSYAAQTGNYFLNFLINEIPDDCDCESLGNIQIDSPFPSELICESYGDYYLKYVVYSNTGAVVSIDSVYCTPFILTELQISL